MNQVSPKQDPYRSSFQLLWRVDSPSKSIADGLMFFFYMELSLFLPEIGLSPSALVLRIEVAQNRR